MKASAPVLPPTFARHWAKELCSKENTLVQLKGGINNHVYRCGHKPFWVIKGYAPLKSVFPDRMQAEVDFLKYAANVAPNFTPNLIHVDDIRRCVVMEFLEGEPFQIGLPPPEIGVRRAVDFFRKLNSDPIVGNQFIRHQAAEGFASVTEHLKNVRQRLSRMTIEHIHAEIQPEAKRLLTLIQAKYRDIYQATSSKIENGELVDFIQSEDRCISPSDFGFHNAVLTSEGVKFFDFEFAGWDDPAKAAADFILQPRVPVMNNPSPLLGALNISEMNPLRQRYKALMPILTLKWVCIILSVFDPARLEQIKRITPTQENEALITERIMAASAFLKRTQPVMSDWNE